MHRKSSHDLQNRENQFLTPVKLFVLSRKLEALLSIRLSEVTRSGESLDAVMQEISEKAKARGLTSEILKSLLDEE